MSELAELKSDSNELKELLQVAKRPRVKDVLQNELSSVNTKIDEIELKKAKEEEKLAAVEPKESFDVVQDSDSKPNVTVKQPKEAKVQRSKITSFGYDQSAANYSIYIDLKGVGSLDKEQVKVEFTTRSFNLVVSNLNGKTYELAIPQLGGDIVPEKSKYKVKQDKITVTLKKAKQGDWKGLSEKEAKGKKAKEQEKSTIPEVDKDKDPSESLMDMMKKMYEEGDDDMKRTIAKAWTESREKQASGDMGLSGLS